METTTCLLCGEASYQPLFKGVDFITASSTTFPVVRCKACGLVYLRERPDRQEIKNYYPEHYAPFNTKAGARDVVPLWDAGNPIKRATTRWVLRNWYGYPAQWNGGAGGSRLTNSLHYLPRYRNIPFFVPNGKLLEFGCGTGVYLRRMQQLGWDVYGIEPGAQARAQAQARGMNHILPDLFEARFPDHFFDAVAAWQVIEHVHDPVAYFRELARITKPGGQLLLSTINIRSPEAWMFGKFWHNWEIPRHLVFFTGKSLRQMAEKGGWKVVEISHQTTPNSIIHSLNRLAKERWPRAHGRWLNRFLSVGNNLWQRLFYPVTLLWGFLHCAGRINLIAEPRGGGSGVD